ncbi:MAG: hypothetical protein GX471_17915 [Candidatus Microthrix parvicella]|uniref:hypothetical protein n=1 Tax=Candidatus Neomicrothrix sp. TaxID=2719034 RepID=UPI00169F8DCA|nr:hypothetical protein [Candidatus Microthrix sp.]NLH68022.1 hypothetical protein [Candidatus Microthrix parvicella]MBL0202835.1 hypothetical protein [Candidatus Microthrix sp.]MBP6136060.1 hypothetical protein [Candidatus Microthrix sp.]MBP6151008.1 hypothetical protein [Candidatus Microthrix sp.]MBP7987667.1 hypothetical protein [Candidatus Microthrix sp.]
METSDNPVQAALDERRDRRAQRHRLESDLTLADRCRDAAERALWVRVYLLGGTTLAGTAVAVTDDLLTLDRTGGTESGSSAHIDVGALVRVTVAHPAPRRRSTVDPTPHGSAVTNLVADLARRGTDLEITTSDGSVLCGSLVSLGDRALGFVIGQRHGETRESSGGFDDRVDWVDPAHIVSVAAVG